MKNTGKIIIISSLAVIAVFLFLRLPAIHQIYHQDEYRWATIADPFFNSFSSPHPPLTRWLLRADGLMFGFNNLRVVPFVFSFLSLILIYFIATEAEDRKTGSLAAVMFSISIYSVIASLQIDIDGAILPFFVLLGYLAYSRVLKGQRIKIWLLVLALATVGGLLSKLSFIIFLGTLLVDYFWTNYELRNLKKNFIRLAPWLGGVAVALAIFYFVYAGNLSMIISYAQNFRIFNFMSRAYFDLAFKVLKSIVWLSPMLFLPVVFGIFKKEIWTRYRFWYLYLFANAIFYLIIFDFTKLTIERYLMFLIAPSVIISAGFIRNLMVKAEKIPKINRMAIIIIAAAGISFFLVNINSKVLPLNPKNAFIEQIKSFDFRFLIPFNGGSGPTGFYFSALYIVLAWFGAAWALLAAIFSKKRIAFALTVFLAISVIYNLLFVQEYLVGGLYGSPAKVARAATDYVISDGNIPEVITYNDVGAYDLRLAGKYLSRFYTAEARDYTVKLASYKGYYLIVNFPLIDKNGRYWPILDRCARVKTFQDKDVQALILDCR